jgi:WD40-like Beta Propeller Repeat
VTKQTRSMKLIHAALAIIAVAALTLYILACRPSWSPDGRTVVYSYWDEGAQKSAIAMFDRKTRTSRVIFELASETNSSNEILAAQWAKDGVNVIVALPAGDNGTSVLLLPQNAQKPVRAFTIEHMEESDDLGLIPLPQIGNQLFVAGSKWRTRINLETGEIYSYQQKEKNECVLTEAGDKIFYMRELEVKGTGHKEGEAKKETGQQKNSDVERAYEFGELDQKDLSFHATITLKTQDLTARGIGDPTGYLDVAPGDLKIAATADGLGDTDPRILVIGQSGIEQILEGGIKGQPYTLGNPQWSRDGKLIYVPALIKNREPKRAEFAVVEVRVDGSGSRIDQIEEISMEQKLENFLSYVQIALSPDGKLIAASTGQVENAAAVRKGLFLLDVSKANRPVEFYPAPALPKRPKKE